MLWVTVADLSLSNFLRSLSARKGPAPITASQPSPPTLCRAGPNSRCCGPPLGPALPP